MRIIFFIGLVDLLLTIITYIYYRCNWSWAKGWLFGASYFLLASMTWVSRLLPETAPLWLIRSTSWVGGLWIAFVYYSLLLAIGHGILYLASKLAGTRLPNSKLAAAGLACICIFVSWGAYRAFTPVVRTEKIVSSKLPAGSAYRLVLLSDVHLGRLLGYSCAKKLTAQVNSLRPDAVLIAGDLLDERVSYVLQDDSLAPLAELKAPQGVYLAKESSCST